jgi:hypothetical protein
VKAGYVWKECHYATKNWVKLSSSMKLLTIGSAVSLEEEKHNTAAKFKIKPP